MRHASFLLISIAFHAAVLAFPISHRDYEKGGSGAIPVLFLSGGEGDSKAQVTKEKAKTVRIKEKPQVKPRRHVKLRKTERKSPRRAPEPVNTADVGNQVRVDAQDGTTEKFIIAKSKETTGVEIDWDMSLEEVAEESRVGESGGGGDSRIGKNLIEREEAGDSSGLVFARAGYAYTPKPEYPERARREGWEGTVLLRVLVDRRGKSKRVEVSRSSGFEILDGAAMETVKGWRFHSARYGERRVESWVKVPVVFRLADLKNR